MARRSNRVENSESQELNLAPIMNMVVILIPLLLLSVVFISVSVINVSVPTLCCEKTTDSKPEKPLLLNISVDFDGFYISTANGVLPPLDGCMGKASVCLKRQIDTRAQFARASQLIQNGQRQQGEEILNQALSAYDWRSLYNTLSQIKRNNPNEYTATVSASPDMPYAVVIRIFDVSRNQLQKDHYDTTAAFWSAKPKQHKNKRLPLFDAPTLSIVQ